MANRLQYEKSPYLQQHKDNPVDWYSWGPEAFEKAKNEDKPILLSIGYATCHWCHVMARESFEDESIASLMNELFVNIKVDREELPAVDHYYMDAIQLLIGSGGWPLNCFLTPDRKPFLGGTYFPTEDRGRQVSWRKVLLHVAKVFQRQREQVEEQAKRIHARIESRQSDDLKPLLQWETNQSSFDLDDLIHQTQSSWDLEYGGMKGAPKFPMPHLYSTMFHWFLLSNNNKLEAFIKRTARAFIHGGLFDPVHGGFARYCVDERWQVPHFEKMLYDNAGIISLLSLLVRQSADPYASWALHKTVDFLENHMRDQDKMFYSAVDADSEGKEGKFYTWSESELLNTLTEKEIDVLSSYFSIEDDGNWEGTNVLYSNWATADTFLKEYSTRDLDEILDKLKLAAGERVSPSTDTKKLVDWNALMIQSLFQASMYSGSTRAEKLAREALDTILAQAVTMDGELAHHAKMSDEWYGESMLDDYAFLIQACISAYVNSFDLSYLKIAEKLTRKVIERFSSSDLALFYSIQEKSTQLDFRPVAFYDTPYPSANAVMSKNLFTLGKYFDRMDWIERAEKMIHQVEDKINKYPTAFGKWIESIIEIQERNHEIAIIGPSAVEWAREINRKGLPNTIIMAHKESNKKLPLLDRKVPKGKTQIFLCENYSCQLPIDALDSFWKEYAKLNPFLHDKE